jgi:predicted AAA+ superfamily ATPase
MTETCTNLLPRILLDFIKAFPNGAVIDEVQKVPEIFEALKYHVDQTAWTPGKYILTGSSQFRLKKYVRQHVRTGCVSEPAAVFPS